MSKRGNGEGSIYAVYEKDENGNIIKDKNGKEKIKYWIGQFTDGKREDGKINRKSVYGNTRKEVKDKLHQKLDDVSKGISTEKCTYTVYELGKELLETKYQTNIIKGTSYNTISYPLNKIKSSNIGNINIQKVSYKNIQDFLNTITDLSNSYIEKIIIQLNLIFNEAINRDYIYKSPMKNIKKPISKKTTKKVDAFSIEEQKKILKEFKNSSYNDIFTIAIFTGLRIGELLALILEDIDFQQNVIHITKTLSKDKNNKLIIGETTKTSMSNRDIPITSLFENNLKNAIKNMKPNKYNTIFTNKNSTLLSPNNTNGVFKRLCKKASINRNVNIHMLRHTYATRMIEAGIPAEVLQKLLGHKNITTTINTYTTIFDKFKNDEVSKCTKFIETTFKNVL